MALADVWIAPLPELATYKNLPLGCSAIAFAAYGVGWCSSPERERAMNNVRPQSGSEC